MITLSDQQFLLGARKYMYELNSEAPPCSQNENSLCKQEMRNKGYRTLRMTFSGTVIRSKSVDKGERKS